jgi:hypothetical protein
VRGEQRRRQRIERGDGQAVVLSSQLPRPL